MWVCASCSSTCSGLSCFQTPNATTASPAAARLTAPGRSHLFFIFTTLALRLSGKHPEPRSGYSRRRRGTLRTLVRSSDRSGYDAGRAGTGFTEIELAGVLEPLETRQMPLDQPPRETPRAGSRRAPPVEARQSLIPLRYNCCKRASESQAEIPAY